MLINLTNMFETFWIHYPRKADKKKARISFNKLKPEQQHKAINDCVNRFNGIEKCFIPLPTTYLHGERWEDDPIPRKEIEPDWDLLASQHARPGESLAEFKTRWSSQ